ncbi:MAG: nucleoside kinase [Lachnospiraceae bacterium]|nr:nucleoside kinase [Lachnospiraceae bacterium]
MNTDKTITLAIQGKECTYPVGITYGEIAKEFQKEYPWPIAVANHNGRYRELFQEVDTNGELEFLDLSTTTGHSTYMRTAILLFVKAVNDVVGMSRIGKLKLEFSMSTGYFFSFDGDVSIDDELIAAIDRRMREMVDAKTPINKDSFPLTEATKIFEEQNMPDKVKTCYFRRSRVINLYEIDGYFDYYYGYMLPNMGMVKHFEVLSFKNGFILNLPTKKEPETIPEFKPLPKIYSTMMAATALNDVMGINVVGDLNEQLVNGDYEDMILVSEALQERNIANIATDIAKHPGVKFVMIAGPSSSGKTSFSHRLSIQLKTLGFKPHPIAVDDYFVNREDTPRDENGDYNFECLEAIDVKLFNDDMVKLLSGEEVPMPTFNFKSGQREYRGNTLKLGPDDVLVIEGIHALNDKMSAALPTESKYKIYISALTTLNIDEHNRIPTTDARLLRRMVRDFRTRGNSAARTIQMWGSVRKGEEENIFPFQEGANAIFNSALIYEIAALKSFAEPLLYSVPCGTQEYYEARRLLKFLEYFLAMDTAKIPTNSICREFVGGSIFNV